MGTILRPSRVQPAMGTRSSVVGAVLGLHPSDVLARPPEFPPASLLLFATPQYANDLYETIAENSLPYSVFAAVVDVVPPGGRRDGISYLWTEKPISLDPITSRSLDSSRSHDHHDGVHSHGMTETMKGRFIAKGGQNWVLTRLYMGLGFNQGTKDIRIQTASTLFETGVEGIMLAREPGREVQLYGTMELQVPLDILFESADREPALEAVGNLLEEKNTPMYVTAKKDNIIKTINGRPASLYLEASLSAGLFLEPGVPPSATKVGKKLEENGTHRSVYAVLDDDLRYKVIAGGGEWGKSAGLLVLDPDASVREGAKIQFFVSKTEAELSEAGARELELGDDEKGRVFFECVAPIQFWTEEGASTGEDRDAIEEVALDNVFGAGSENRFFVGRKTFDVHGEYCVALVAE
ncbi:uncharacterized protein V1518DRAFT_438078 [Limtongia smithiae]|uniref:uncharacterized protein n=1 Tax=Limtongia smithiae TaxID=1125753 RepID=UPI0034CE5AD0